MTTLDKLKNDWESLAESDPLWAILTDESKKGRRWDWGEFMSTGEIEIDTVMRYLESIECTPDFNGAALDFGCGVGRLTQALARRFTASVGVDIAPEMIRNAERLNRYLLCRYHVISGTRLPFPDQSFVFVYSNIVLQHVPRAFATEYLAEFVRVLAPGGVLVFGVQDRFAMPTLSAWMIRVRSGLRLRSRLREALRGGEARMQMHCLPEPLVRASLGSAAVVDVRFTNTAARDFNGRLVYLKEAPRSGYVGKQYCVVKQRADQSRLPDLPPGRPPDPAPES